MKYKDMIVEEYQKMILVKHYFNRKAKKEARLNLHVELWSQIIENDFADKADAPVLKILGSERYFPVFDCFFCETQKNCERGDRGFYGKCPLSVNGDCREFIIFSDDDNSYTGEERRQAAFNIMTLKGEM